MASNYCISVAGITIDVTVTDSASAVNEWVKCVRGVYGSSRIIVGIDFKKKQNRYGDGNGTLQLCVGIKCLIFQLYHLDYIHQSLKTFFDDSNVIFVRHDDRIDANNLSHRYGLTCTNLVDILDLAKRRYPELKVWTLESLPEKFAGLTISVERTDLFSSDWEARQLSLEQIKYACSHAYASFRIGQAIIQ